MHLEKCGHDLERDNCSLLIRPSQSITRKQFGEVHVWTQELLHRGRPSSTAGGRRRQRSAGGNRVCRAQDGRDSLAFALWAVRWPAIGWHRAGSCWLRLPKAAGLYFSSRTAIIAMECHCEGWLKGQETAGRRNWNIPAAIRAGGLPSVYILIL